MSMMIVWIAIVVAIGATIAVHLGLPQAISVVFSKVCRCHKCMSFWSTLIVLTCTGANLFVTLLLSLLAAYLSSWIAVLLVLLNRIYELIWK